MNLPVPRRPAHETLTVLAPDATSCGQACRELQEQGWRLLSAMRREDGQVELRLFREDS